ncbi:hypothetical protein FE236_09105 [Mariprofundus erugo]|uniref:hypothetical protein n=1 Tax=Mariprofundus erugo TaxID=2528639 RepID=UPI0010FD0D70|nr:hypothetical protein [Mariprofundus erugo]TLS75600.1 hypothetical protein FE236_09105 [Mariprofundus erugo]
MTTSLATETPVTISARNFEIMLDFSRTVFSLKDNPAYLAALETSLPHAARVPTRWPSVLMGFDFHLTPAGPRLIEINNNAGGLYIGDDRWLPQMESHPDMPGDLGERILAMFPSDWSTIAIMDEDVTRQFMYPEMCAYADLLRASGRQAFVLSPEDLVRDHEGLHYRGERIDAIYNRHTDFYLEGADLAEVRAAYQEGKVIINPHPRSYALIGDKTRMVDWWREGLLESCLDAAQVALIRTVTPSTHRLSEMDRERVWSDRKDWVFKPAARHGGKGVVIGKGISRVRFDTLDPEETIVQQLVPASEIEVGGQVMKLDIRLYMHGTRLIGMAGRAWRGQVTNFREPGSGWVSLTVEH